MKKKLIFTLLLLVSFNLCIVFALAQGNTTGGQNNPGNTTGGQNSSGQTSGQTQTIKFSFPNPFSKAGNDLFTVMKNIVNQVILPIGGVIAVLAFIFTGFKYVMAKGKPDKIQEANRALLYTAIGTAILLGAWVIANVIGNTVNQLMP